MRGYFLENKTDEHAAELIATVPLDYHGVLRLLSGGNNVEFGLTRHEAWRLMQLHCCEVAVTISKSSP